MASGLARDLDTWDTFGAGLAVYVLWLQDDLSGLIARGMQFILVFVITGISGILFPYRKNARGIREASP